MLRHKKRITLLLIVCMALLKLTVIDIKASEEDPYDLLRNRFLEIRLGGHEFDMSNDKVAIKIEAIENEAITYWNSMNTSASMNKAYLWEDLNIQQAYEQNDKFKASKGMNKSYRRLKAMAMGYRNPSSDLYQNEDLRDDILHGLEYMHVRWYNKSKNMHPNYYYFKAAIPNKLIDIITLCYDDIEPAKRNTYLDATRKFLPNLDNVTGANMADRATIFIMRGVLTENEEEINYAREKLLSMFDYVTSGDGFYDDGAFIMHKTHKNVFNYGRPMLDATNTIMRLTENSIWELESDKKNNMYKWVEDTFEPLIYKGQVMDAAYGRAVTSQGDQTNYRGGHLLIGTIAEISTYAPEQYANRFREMVKYLIEEDTYADFFEHAKLGQINIVMDILENANSRGPKAGVYHFRGNDNVLQRTESYAYMVSMYSKRVSNYESINKENLKGWHHADGMGYLYDSDLTRYEDNFWPTVDSFRLPGTTYIYKEKVPSGRSDKSWVGGAYLDNKYSTAGMELHPVASSLNARKSWFMLDDEIVAMGSNISSTNGRVETTIDNYKLNENGDNDFIVNGVSQSKSLGTSKINESVEWMTLYGNDDANIGYYFPESVTLNTLREKRESSWHSINANFGSQDKISNNFLTLWLDHGSSPSNKKYAYVILPNKDANETQAYAENPHISILAHEPDLHAIKENQQRILAANFFNPQGGTVDYLSVNTAASVIIEESDTTFKISVSDPTQENNGSIIVDLERGGSILTKDDGISVTSGIGDIRIIIDVQGARGDSFQAEFQKAEDPIVTSLINENFEEELVGNEPINFDINEHVDECAASIQYDPNGGENKVLYLYDNSPATGIDQSKNFSEHQVVATSHFESKDSGILEISWDLYNPEFKNNDFNKIIFESDETPNIVFIPITTKKKELRIGLYGNKPTKFENMLTSNQWVNIKVKFNLDEGVVKLYVDDTLLTTQNINPNETIDKVHFTTSTTRHTEYYIDNLSVNHISY